MPPRSEPQEVLELVVFGGRSTSRHPLPAEGQVSLGRSEENDIQIDDTSISRRHAIVHLGPKLRVEDLGSANGTRVRREQRAGETTKLPDTAIERGRPVEIAIGDAISLGQTLVVILRREAPAVGAGAAGAAEPVLRDEAMQRLYAGAGKEILAEHIHRRSPRAGKHFLKLNCAALSESLLESELFGHEKGAFTSAIRAKPGLLETADKGTVFLDEVGELPPSIQVKLLRVLEDRQVTRVGGLQPKSIDVRFIAATNRDLTAEVKRGTFREDLFFRLNGISLTIPPLRARVAEIEPLARLFAIRAAGALGRQAPAFSPAAMTALMGHRWPGNVRELRNVIERAVVLCPGDVVFPEHLLLDTAGAPPPAAPPPPVPEEPAIAVPAPSPAGDLRSELDEIERRRILDALEKCAGNQTQAAALLGMPRRTFVARLTAYGIPRPRKK
jgi:hypothetical protein